jgi:hypothetical protein
MEELSKRIANPFRRGLQRCKAFCLSAARPTPLSEKLCECGGWYVRMLVLMCVPACCQEQVCLLLFYTLCRPCIFLRHLHHSVRTGRLKLCMCVFVCSCRLFPFTDASRKANQSIAYYKEWWVPPSYQSQIKSNQRIKSNQSIAYYKEWWVPPSYHCNFQVLSQGAALPHFHAQKHTESLQSSQMEPSVKTCDC